VKDRPGTYTLLRAIASVLEAEGFPLLKLANLRRAR
jgi:hypothetical protein